MLQQVILSLRFSASKNDEAKQVKALYNGYTVFVMKWGGCRTFITWSDDILSCEATKVLILGLKNLAMFVKTPLTSSVELVLVHKNTPQDGAIMSKAGVPTGDTLVQLDDTFKKSIHTMMDYLNFSAKYISYT